jgi:hypothetical protein
MRRYIRVFVDTRISFTGKLLTLPACGGMATSQLVSAQTRPREVL